MREYKAREDTVVRALNSRKLVTLYRHKLLFLLVFLAFSGNASSEVVHPERLQAALDRYMEIATNGGWPVVPEGPTIRPGSTDPRIAVLAARLRASGDLGDSTYDSVTYDEVLRGAVMHFQERHGLERDGLVGQRTLHAMNVPVEQRVRQIRLNLERASRLDAESSLSLVLINIPSFQLTLFRGGEPAWSSRVVVGEANTETPQFEAYMTHAVLNPDWTVPRTIAIEELLPKIQQDAGFLQRGGYDVFNNDGKPLDPSNIEWKTLDRNNFPLTIVQRPGPLNELGRIKFMFPNEHGVCMHDTPKKYLFARSSRDFSHGCVRLQDPLELGVHVLAAEGWTQAMITRQIESGTTRTVVLEDPLRVLLTYLTVDVAADDTVYFYPDIYSRDGLP
jgi:murein L,D-transpeptidase YcbB/YkuD